jgi:probable phosphoglycerate mutase
VNDQLSFDTPDSDAVEHEELSLWFDGASRGNGQAGARASIGGVVRDTRTGAVLAEVSETIGEETNNVAEYRALLATIEAANAFGARRLRVHGDSALVINQLQGRWKVKAAHLLPLLRSVQRAMAGYEAVELAHIPRADNHEADALANAALDGDDETEDIAP